MNKEIEDALHMLLHCSLKDTEYETQVEQYKLVRNYITNLQQENKQLKDNWNKLKEYLHNVDVVIDYSENYDGSFINYDELVNKMEELEGSDSNE